MTSARLVWQMSRAILADQSGYVVVLKMYMDESGTDEGSPVVTVGAYIAKPSVWRDWTKEWNREKKPIKIYHAVDCANRTGEFEGWERPKRDEFVKKMLPIIANRIPMGIAIGINMESFNATMKPHPELRELFGSPYIACFHWVVQKILNEMGKRLVNRRIAFFHEMNDFKEEALKTFDWIKKHRPEGRQPITIAFGAKEDYVPLQAADILAYEANHVLRNPSKMRRRSWEALSPDQKGIDLLHYGAGNMEDLIFRLSNLRKEYLASGWDGKVE